MEAKSLVSHQHSWWFICFSLREKLARSHNKKAYDIRMMDTCYHMLFELKDFLKPLCVIYYKGNYFSDL